MPGLENSLRSCFQPSVALDLTNRLLNENEEEPHSVRNRLRSHQQELAAPHKKENDRDR